MTPQINKNIRVEKDDLAQPPKGKLNQMKYWNFVFLASTQEASFFEY